jgi:DNA-binding GntR family transcriptional regulator
MEIISLSDFDRLPLHKLVYEKLRDLILTGGILPGEKLVENDISRQLKISKTPIREAIRELSQEGLLIHTTRRGIRVIDFTEKDVDEIIFLRAELERIGVEKACGNLDDSDFMHIDSTLQQLAVYEQSRDYAAMAKADMGFHEHIMEKSDNTRLVKAWKTIASQMLVLLNSIDFYALSSDYAHKNHREILNLLKESKATEVSQVIKDHILTSRVLILQKMAKQKNVKEL